MLNIEQPAESYFNDDKGGIASEKSQDSEVTKGKEGSQTGDKEKDGQGSQDPTKAAESQDQKKEEQQKAADEFRVEMVKRFGDLPDDQLAKKAWEAYRNIEPEFQRKSAVLSEQDKLIQQFGGLEALRAVLSDPGQQPARSAQKQPAQGEFDNLPDDLAKMVEDGQLDPEDPKDQMILRQEMILRSMAEKTYQGQVKTANEAFNKMLKDDILPKYPDADLDAIKAKVYAGAFRGLNDEAFKVAIEDEAKKQHERFESKLNERTQSKLDSLKEASKKSAAVGKSVSTPHKSMNAQQRFEEEYSKHFAN